MIETLTHQHLGEWLALRRALWPHCTEHQHRAEIEDQLADPARCRAFIARAAGAVPAGFVEAAIRYEPVNGTTRSPVAFLEGIYVAANARREGVARALVDAVIDWARSAGIDELASDTDLGNTVSRRVHAALGFEETEQVVFFRRSIRVGP